jgi:hypothetical protein
MTAEKMRPGIDERRCRNCCWWVRGQIVRSASGEPIDTSGECHRRAPTVKQAPSTTRDIWPSTLGSEYCGDWDAVVR